ncbi:L-histidine N(alpha)-methyltransferase [uncultured Algimonas sp.]|uniref:L-histidine N(alpha)-methyltransferase n=1 Tax=uncultured Algimonas sp. TaxID=1547920 RepID=UPI0026173599|nr:L-histidine N(alpha)-methyltransferase [uncultured Algimonas sp.]
MTRASAPAPSQDDFPNAFLDDVLSGLSQPQKSLPCRWFYDARGSALFERITALPEYYLTRTETAILERVAPDLAAMMGPDAVLVEYGAGASVKTRILLDAAKDLRAYVPIDVSEGFLLETADRLRADYPILEVRPVVADFLSEIALPPLSDPAGRRVGFFPGSTVGNLSDADIDRFLRQARRMLGADGRFILGFDRVKPLSVLLPAYDDAQGVTADFNLNLLRRINRELDGDFDLSGFDHEARWNDAASRVEMHLVAHRAQTVRVGGQTFDFSPGETIHTEDSRKFTPERMKALCARAGWSVEALHSDPDEAFSVAVLRPA